MPLTFGEQSRKWLYNTLGKENIIRKNILGDPICTMRPELIRSPMNTYSLVEHSLRDGGDSIDSLKHVFGWKHRIDSKDILNILEKTTEIGVKLGLYRGFAELFKNFNSPLESVVSQDTNSSLDSANSDPTLEGHEPETIEVPEYFIPSLVNIQNCNANVLTGYASDRCGEIIGSLSHTYAVTNLANHTASLIVKLMSKVFDHTFDQSLDKTLEKKLIEGDFTCFGLDVEKDTENKFLMWVTHAYEHILLPEFSYEYIFDVRPGENDKIIVEENKKRFQRGFYVPVGYLASHHIEDQSEDLKKSLEGAEYLRVERINLTSSFEGTKKYAQQAIETAKAFTSYKHYLSNKDSFLSDITHKDCAFNYSLATCQNFIGGDSTGKPCTPYSLADRKTMLQQGMIEGFEKSLKQ